MCSEWSAREPCSGTLKPFETLNCSKPQQQVSARLPKTFHADRHDVSEIIVCLVLVPCISARELESKIV